MKMKNYILIGFLLLFHIIGLVLFYLDPSNAELTWLNMLVCLAVITIAELPGMKWLLSYFVIFLGGLIIEGIGVQTGYLFGSYQYGSALGIKILNTPLMIGVNWVCIIVAASSVVRLFKFQKNTEFGAFIGAALATGMDYVIEPVAIKYDMWSWQGDFVPVSNYITWFLFSYLFSYLYLKQVKKTNSAGAALLIIWVIFFLTVKQY